MKKITLKIFSFLVFGSLLHAQTYTTGTISLSSTSGLEYTAQIDVTSTEVTLTLIGPSDRWLGLGFDATTMLDGQNDVVIFDGTDLTDRTFTGGRDIPTLDNQDWSLDSNTILSGVRTLVATRDLDTGEANDYDFVAAEGSVNLVWARGNGATFTLGHHGSGNRGATASNITLGIDENNIAENFNIYPNPSSTKFNINLPNNIDKALVKVFDVLGKEIYNNTISSLNTTIDVATWSKGVYVIKVEMGNRSQTKRFIKQ